MLESPCASTLKVALDAPAESDALMLQLKDLATALVWIEKVAELAPALTVTEAGTTTEET
jgi:hypothetical protein